MGTGFAEKDGTGSRSKGLSLYPFQVDDRCPRLSAKTAPARRQHANGIPSVTSARPSMRRRTGFRSADGRSCLSGIKSGNSSGWGNNCFYCSLIGENYSFFSGIERQCFKQFFDAGAGEKRGVFTRFSLPTSLVQSRSRGHNPLFCTLLP